MSLKKRLEVTVKNWDNPSDLNFNLLKECLDVIHHKEVEVETHVTKVSELSAFTVEKDTTIKKLTDEVARLNAVLATEKERTSAETTKVTELTNQVRALTSDLETSRTKVSTLEKSVRDATTKLTTATAKLTKSEAKAKRE